MSDARALLDDLTARGVRLWADGDRLCYEDPDEVLTRQDFAAMRRDKPGLLRLLRPAGNGAAAPAMVDAGREGAAEVEAPVLVSLDTVIPRLVEWMRPQRWPRGKLVLVVGDPGLGKSWLLLDAAARFSTGAPWPEGAAAPQGPVVLLTAEDALDDTVVPRLTAMGADVSRITALTAIRRQDGGERTVSLATDLPHLTAAVERLRPVAVIIDPLTAYLGGTDSHTDAEVRGLLAPLAKLAADGDTLVLALMHLNKAVQMKALYRVGGSVAFTAAARAVFAVVADPDSEGRRLFVPVKMNLGPTPPALAFRLGETGLAWEADPVGRVDLEAALRGPAVEAETSETRNGVADAEQFLRDLLREGPVRYDDVVQARKDAGITERTLDRAKARLRVFSRKAGFSGKWEWILPETEAEGCQPAAPEGCQSPLTRGALAPFDQPPADSHESAPTLPKGANDATGGETGTLGTLDGPSANGGDPLADRGARLLAELEARDWPRLPRRPGVTAGDSEAAWRAWLRRAVLADLEWLEAALDGGGQP